MNFNYFVSDAVADFVIEAVALLADEGWKLVPDYRFDPATGLWRHRDGPVEPPLRLRDLSFDADGVLRHPPTAETADESALAGYLDQARALLAERVRRGRSHEPAPGTLSPGSSTCAGSSCPPPASRTERPAPTGPGTTKGPRREAGALRVSRRSDRGGRSRPAGPSGPG